MDDLSLSTVVRAEIHKLSYESHVTPDFLRDMSISERVLGEFASTLAVRVVTSLAGRVVETTEHEREISHKSHNIGYTQFPKTWWDGLKLQLIQSKWLDWMFPLDAISTMVEFQSVEVAQHEHTHLKQTIHHWHMCPLPSGHATPDGYVNFLSWNRAFDGSQREYVLLRNIAREALLCSEDRPSVDLMRLLSAYVHESEILSDRYSVDRS